MTDRRSYATALLALAAGGIGLVVAYGLTWASADVPLLAGAADVAQRVDLSGREVLPAAAAGGWLAVAAVAGVVATRGIGRRVVAVVAVLAGLAGLAGAVVFVLTATSAVEGVRSGATRIATTPAWVLALVAGAVVVLAGAWTLVAGGRWPALGARYERRPAAHDVSPWQAQDLGLDPTDDPRGDGPGRLVE